MVPRDALRRILALPRVEQPAALRRLRAALDDSTIEDWNTRFGPESLYDAWSQTELLRGLYGANAATLHELLADRDGWRIVEVGGGDGRLWEQVLDADAQGEIVLFDPVAEVHERVAERLPGGVRLVSHVAPVERRLGAVPEADAVVCSLTLHHVAGTDAAHRARYGLEGPGKLEVLRAFARAIRPREGRVLVNEADIYCDLDLPPGDPLLVDRLIDSYVRRCGLALCDELDHRADAPEHLRRRWDAILRHWCLAQVEVADLPYDERDVYELDVPRWVALFARAGLVVADEGFTDRYGLFYRYLLRAVDA